MNYDISKNVQKPRKRTGRPPKHAGYSIVGRDELMTEYPCVRKYVQDCRDGLIRDCAGRESELTTGQAILIDRAVQKISLIRLIEVFLARHGALSKAAKEKNVLDLEPIVERWQTANNSLRQDLALLGIERRERGEGVVDLGRYLETKATESKGQGKASGAGEIVEPGAPGRDPGEKS